jgi:hypothetical protein
MDEEIDSLFQDKNANKNFVDIGLFQGIPELYDLNSIDDHKRFFIQEKNEEIAWTTKEKNSTQKTKTKTTTMPIVKNVKDFFLIIKVNKKLGRLSKNSQLKTGKHNKYVQDNIIQKIKVYFVARVYNYINLSYKIFLKSRGVNEKKIASKLFKKIPPEIYNSIKREDNLKWFSFKLKDIFSSDISPKYKTFEHNFNKKKIESLYLNNEAKNVIEILEKTVREMYLIYCNDLKFEGFKTLKDDLVKIRKKMMESGGKDLDIQEYLKKYKETALSLKMIFSEKKPKQKKGDFNNNYN